MSEEQRKKSPEAIAAKSCSEAAGECIDGWTGAEIAVAAWGQAQQSQAAINGVVRLLLHKGILKETDLGDSMAWSYRERADQLRAMGERALHAKNGAAILLPPTARGQ